MLLRKIKTITIILTIIAMYIIGQAWCCRYTIRYCEVSQINANGSISIISRNTGDTWIWDGDKPADIKIGDNCSLKMDDNYTEDNRDDKILSVIWKN